MLLDTMDPSEVDVTQRVDNGWALLSEKWPGWQERVVRPIYAGSTQDCPVGQGKPDNCWGFTSGLEALGISDDDAWFYGFDLGFSDPVEFPALTNEWRDRLGQSDMATW